MKRVALAGASYAFCLPDGGWGASSLDSHVGSSEGRVELPGENVLALVGTRHRGRLLMAGQGHDSGGCWLWDGAWKTLGPTFGVSPCAFGDGLLCWAVSGTAYRRLNLDTGEVTEHALAIGSQGLRYVDASNTPIPGDQTYRDGELFEWTRRGNVVCGQGHDGGAVINGRVLDPGDRRFIRFERAGDDLAVAMVDLPGRSAILIWLHTSEIAGLPLSAALPNPGPILPIPGIPPTEPTMEIPDQTHVVAAVRATYPTPLGAQHGACLIEIARAIGQGAGLLRKDSGTHIVLPDGTRVSQDIICFPDGDIYDCLGDAEGEARPTWSRANGGPLPSRYYRVSAEPEPSPEPSPEPEPTPPSGDVLVQILAELRKLSRHLGVRG